jgi:nucleotide-binding universal stress UspA family protein
MNEPFHVVVAIDDSEASERALAYAGSVLRNADGVMIYPLHVLGPVPPELGGASGATPTESQRDIQAAWMTAARADARPLLERARSALENCGIPADAIKPRTTEVSSGDDVAEAIVIGARSLGCGTVVVGRDSISWVPQLFYRHIAETVARDAGGMAVWIVG